MAVAAEWLEKRRKILGDTIAGNELLQKELDLEFRRQDDDRQALSNHMSELIIRGSKTDALLKENEQLRIDLAVALQGQKEPTSHINPESLQEGRRDVAKDGEDTEATVPYEDYDALAKKYNNVYSTFKHNEREYTKTIKNLVDKLHSFKDRVRGWDEYRARKAAKQGTSDQNALNVVKDPRLALDLPEGPQTPSTTYLSSSALPAGNGLDLLSLDGILRLDHSRPGSSSKHLDDLRPVPTRLNMSTTNCEVMEDLQDNHLRAANEQEGKRPTTSGSGMNSSQATDDELPIQPPPSHEAQEGADEEPVFISSRPVRRLRKQATHLKAVESAAISNGDGPDRMKIKEENVTSSSPVRALSEKRKLARTETVDLDEVGGLFDTPRKRQRFMMARGLPRNTFRTPGDLNRTRNFHLPYPTRAIDNGRANSMPLEVKNEPIEEDVQSESAGILPLALVRSNSDSVLESGMNEHDLPLENAGDGDRARTGPARSPINNSRALHELSLNERVLPKARKSDERGAKAIHFLSEDGDPQLRGRRAPRKSNSKSPARQIEGNKRLQSLLETETPQKHVLKALPTPPTSNGPRVCPRPTSHLRPTKAPCAAALHSRLPVGLRNQAPTTVSFGRYETRQSDRGRQIDTPVRSRPLEQLRITDFKPNPNYIGHHLGMDAVRNRDFQRCLPGCTRDCCKGIFRAMAEAGADPVIPGGLFDSSPPEADDTVIGNDRRLLRYHLGDGYDRDAINGMTDVQRKELLLQAKTRYLADKHGRHKRVWERAESPPGFWRTDMATTQELEEDRKKAEQLAREQVRERWEDAMRGGGRWVFRDE